MPKETAKKRHALPEFPCTYYAVTMLFVWPDNWPGPRIYTVTGHTHSSGFLPLFATEEEARAVAKLYPGAQVLPITLTEALGTIEQAKRESRVKKH